jgi:hypothetical protein
MTAVNFLRRYSLPLALLAFCWLSMQTTAAYSDEATRVYGFPLSWNAPNSSSSMAFSIAIGPLLVDLALYVFLTHLILIAACRRFAPDGKAGTVISAVLWLAALASLVLVFAAISSDPVFTGWSLDSYFGSNAMRSHVFWFGPGRWP